MATDLIINIASQFTGKSAFEKAEKSTKLLTKSVKNLAKVTGVALSATAILAYSKKSIKAAADDMKAQKLLAQSLKNVGLAYATVNVENFIGQLEKQTGILDDELRPAFSKLAQVTGSVTKTQSLLKLAFDVSSGSGLDYKSTVDILAKAYVNNNKGLSKLSLGLTQAEIQAMDFADVVELLTKRFDGAGAAAVDSYSGSMAILATSSANAAEIIGTSLIGAIETLGGNDGIKNLGTDIENAAKSTANLIDEMAFLISQIGSIPVVGGALSTFGKGIQNILGNLSPQKLAELTREIQAGRGMNAAPIAGQPFTTGMSITSSTDAQAKTTRLAKAAELEAIKRNKELAKLAKDRANREKEIAKQKKDQLALDKAALALGKGEGVFDLDKIQIQAALLSKQEEINKLGVNATDQQKLQLANEVTRLSIKETMLKLEDALAAAQTATTEKEKQLAIAEATRLANKLNMDTAILGVLQKQDFTVKSINAIIDEFKPKNLINIQNLNDAYALLIKMAGLQIGTTAAASTAVITATDNSAAALAASQAATAAAQAAAAAAAAAEAKAKAELEAALAKSAAEREAAAAAIAKAEAEAAAAKAAIAAAEAAAAAAELLKISIDTLPITTASNIETLTGLRADTPAGTAFSVLLKEHIDTFTDALSSNVLSVLGDEQARLQAMGIFDTVGIGAGSTFDPASFRMRDEGITITIVDKTSGLIEVVQNAVIENTRQGNSLTYVGNVQII